MPTPEELAEQIVESIEDATGNEQVSAAQTVWLAVSEALVPHLGGGSGVTDGDKGDITVSGGGATWSIDNNAITDAKLRDSSALSVIGRSTNSSGDPGDIVAGSDGDVLRRSGTALGFGAVPQSSVTNLSSDLAGKAAASHTHAQADVTNLVSDLAAKVPTTRNINTTAPLAGGGDLSADRTLTVADNSTASKGVVAQAPNDTTKFWRGDATWAAPLGRLVWTSGLDGHIVLDGSTDYPGLMTRSGSTYTLLRDILPASLTVNSGVHLRTVSFRVLCKGPVVIDGVVRNSGNNGTNGASGTPGPGGPAQPARTLGASGAGGPATAGAGGASNPTHPVVTAGSSASLAGAVGGNGGNGDVIFRGGGGGGGSGSGTGGNAGAVTASGTNNGIQYLMTLVRGRADDTTTLWTAGSGGGGGANGSGGAGGGGGSGGGHVVLTGESITGSGSVEAVGGAGGSGFQTGGGGGGGGGGSITLAADVITVSTSVAGGAGGTAGGTGTPGNGGNGADGYVYLITP